MTSVLATGNVIAHCSACPSEFHTGRYGLSSHAVPAFQIGWADAYIVRSCFPTCCPISAAPFKLGLRSESTKAQTLLVTSLGILNKADPIPEKGTLAAGKQCLNRESVMEKLKVTNQETWIAPCQRSNLYDLMVIPVEIDPVSWPFAPFETRVLTGRG